MPRESFFLPTRHNEPSTICFCGTAITGPQQNRDSSSLTRGDDAQVVHHPGPLLPLLQRVAQAAHSTLQTRHPQLCWLPVRLDPRSSGRVDGSKAAQRDPLLLALGMKMQLVAPVGSGCRLCIPQTVHPSGVRLQTSCRLCIPTVADWSGRPDARKIRCRTGLPRLHTQ